MAANITQPSYPLSFSSHKIQSMTHRQWLALSFVFFSFVDIITTYFGIEHFGLVENVSWTSWLINNWGWEGVIIRTLSICLVLMYFYRYIPNKIFNFVKYPSWVILAAYLLATSVNNIYLMIVVS